MIRIWTADRTGNRRLSPQVLVLPTSLSYCILRLHCKFITLSEYHRLLCSLEAGRQAPLPRLVGISEWLPQKCFSSWIWNLGVPLTSDTRNPNPLSKKVIDIRITGRSRVISQLYSRFSECVWEVRFKMSVPCLLILTEIPYNVTFLYLFWNNIWETRVEMEEICGRSC